MKYKTHLYSIFDFWSHYQIPLFFLGWFGISIATLTPLEQLPIHVPGSDKLHHIIGFSSWSLMVAAGKQKTFTYLCLFIFLWGGIIELIQPYVNRYGEWLDFGANTVGIVFTYLLATFVKRILKQPN